MVTVASICSAGLFQLSHADELCAETGACRAREAPCPAKTAAFVNEIFVRHRAALMALHAVLCTVLLVHLTVITQGEKEQPLPCEPVGAAQSRGTSGVPLCSSAFTASGYVTSPNHPNNYTGNTQCSHNLTCASGKCMELVFNQVYLMTSNYSLTIISGKVLVGRYTNSTLSQVFTLSSSATLRLTADFSTITSDFGVSFVTLKANCVGLIVGSGLLRSPEYPGNWSSSYSDGQVFMWGLVATPGKTLTLDFKSLNIDVNNDFLDLYNGRDLIARYTGSTVPPRVTIGPTGRLVFARNSPVHYGGFSIAVNSAAVTCGGMISDFATITSPNYPNSYQASSSCTWIYRALGYTYSTTLQFTAFDLESNHDFVKIYDGQVHRSTYTGSTLPEKLELKSATIMVIFTSDRRTQLTGFCLKFSPLNLA